MLKVEPAAAGLHGTGMGTADTGAGHQQHQKLEQQRAFCRVAFGDDLDAIGGTERSVHVCGLHGRGVLVCGWCRNVTCVVFSMPAFTVFLPQIWKIRRVARVGELVWQDESAAGASPNVSKERVESAAV
jgi:hypothetical protein